MTDGGANANYNGLLVSVNHRMSHHYAILANYTYSHCISEGNFAGELSSPEFQNPYDPDADRSNCAFDLRQIANLSIVASVPGFGNRWARRFASNWQIAPLFAIQSGSWFSPTTGTDRSLTGVGLDRPNIVGPVYERNMATHQWLDTSGFVPNPIGTFGNARAFSLEGPSYFNVDAALSRVIPVFKEQSVQVRFEAFNVTNKVNYSNPTGTENSANFGRILSANSPRILEFALKYNF